MLAIWPLITRVSTSRAPRKSAISLDQVVLHPGDKVGALVVVDVRHRRSARSRGARRSGRQGRMIESRRTSGEGVCSEGMRLMHWRWRQRSVLERPGHQIGGLGCKLGGRGRPPPPRPAGRASEGDRTAEGRGVARRSQGTTRAGTRLPRMSTSTAASSSRRRLGGPSRWLASRSAGKDAGGPLRRVSSREPSSRWYVTDPAVTRVDPAALACPSPVEELEGT